MTGHGHLGRRPVEDAGGRAARPLSQGTVPPRGEEVRAGYDRARLQWLRAKAFVAGSGGVTERTNTVDASEDLARNGQQVREMTRELDLLKSDVDVIAMCLRIRGGTFSPRLEEPGQGEAPEEGD